MHPTVRLPSTRVLEGQRNFVIERSRNKKVLRVDCADTGLLRERVEHSVFLNQRLYEVASELWNVDIDNTGLEFQSDSETIDALHVADPSQIGTHRDLKRQRFDLIVATELIEQLSNPGLFLDSVKQLMLPSQTELLVSVPNAFRLAALCMIPWRIESVQPDFNYCFSYYTIVNLLQKHGLRIEQTHMYLADGPPSEELNKFARLSSFPGRVASRLICSMLPYLGDGLLVVATRP